MRRLKNKSEGVWMSVWQFLSGCIWLGYPCIVGHTPISLVKYHRASQLRRCHVGILSNLRFVANHTQNHKKMEPSSLGHNLPSLGGGLATLIWRWIFTSLFNVQVAVKCTVSCIGRKNYRYTVNDCRGKFSERIKFVFRRGKWSLIRRVNLRKSRP